MDQTSRRAARLLVVDPEGCVLLFKYEDDGRKWWATPGGGLERDETYEQAAAREASEELALGLTRFVPLWCQTVNFTFRGQSIDQVECYFLVRTARDDVTFGEMVRDAHRLEGIVDLHWWSLAEIETTSEQIYPGDLRERLQDLASKAAPAAEA